MKDLFTERLVLRRWRPDDIEPFARMNADPSVMEFYPKLLNRDETEAAVHKMEACFGVDDFGLWALEIQKTGEFIGYVGLSRPSFQAHFTPCVEIGWRLSDRHWGKGLATEAALKVLADGFERIQLSEIVSFTAAINKRSIRVMEKLKMRRRENEDFLHPLIEDGHRLKPHVLFRLKRENWLASVEH